MPVHRVNMWARLQVRPWFPRLRPVRRVPEGEKGGGRCCSS